MGNNWSAVLSVGRASFILMDEINYSVIIYNLGSSHNVRDVSHGKCGKGFCDEVSTFFFFFCNVCELPSFCSLCPDKPKAAYERR